MHRTVPCNKEVSDPKCQQCCCWETLNHHIPKTIHSNIEILFQWVDGSQLSQPFLYRCSCQVFPIFTLRKNAPSRALCPGLFIFLLPYIFESLEFWVLDQRISAYIVLFIISFVLFPKVLLICIPIAIYTNECLPQLCQQSMYSNFWIFCQSDR